jgi:hypothetical protein
MTSITAIAASEPKMPGDLHLVASRLANQLGTPHPVSNVIKPNGVKTWRETVQKRQKSAGKEILKRKTGKFKE